MINQLLMINYLLVGKATALGKGIAHAIAACYDMVAWGI